ncbi:MAG: LON peptidase substrate-binding domain-containing protein, partial [Serratia symbiotica]|nr:LON peptidase substrate-binding domain-containing protein [Serratia symbiotica]
QKEASQDEPSNNDLFKIGTISSILQVLKLPDGTVKVLVEGLQRAYIKNLINHDEYFIAEVELINASKITEKEKDALI